MMEQDKPMDFKTLKAQFQGENNLKVHAKPVIPEKPKAIPTSPTKVSNPLISSINTAVKKGTLLAPRVVFKDDKNLSHQLSPPEGLKGNEQQPVNNSKLQDNTQGEGNIVKRPMKDRNLPLVLPVPPIKAKTPEYEPSPLTPVSASPVKVSTPKKFVFSTTKTSKDVKADTVDNLTPSTQPSPLTPLSVSPANMSTPKRFVFNTKNTAKVEKADTVEIPTPAIRTPEHSAPSLQPPANPSMAANTPSASVPVVPKARVPQISAGERPIPSIPASSIPAQGIPNSASPEPKTPELAIPTPAIRTQPVRKSEIYKTETPVSTFSDATSPKPNIHLHSLSEVIPQPEERHLPDFTDIPPPVIPDFLNEDFSDRDIPSSAIHKYITQVSKSPTISKKSSPDLPNLLLKPLENRSRPSSVTAPSPTPSVEEVLGHSKGRNAKTEVIKENQSSPKSPLLALARAEEMAPVKRTTPLDNRVFNLLERAKRKTTMPQMASTSENTAPFKLDAPKVALTDPVKSEMAQCDPEPLKKVLPQVPTMVKTLPEEASTVPEEHDISALPPVDYVDHTRVPKTHPPETAPVNGRNQSQTSPGVLTVVKPVNPPPPPPRKPLPATPALESPHENRKPPAQHLNIPTTPAEHQETYEDQSYDSFEEPSFEDSEVFEPPAVPNFRPVPPLASGSARPTSAHDEAFLEQWNPKHHTAEETLPNTKSRSYGEVDYGSGSSSFPKPGAQVSVPQDQARSSPVSRDVLSGTLEHNYEDLAVNKKGKTAKNKKQKGPLKNPYADAAAVVEETPKKGLFSRKNSEKAADEKELKKKEKQREKEKEKEKERGKKEQREREKKENEIKKKFKITGQEEAMYQVKVIEDCKGRKNDLLVNAGETVNIIRTTSCPQGKWLAKDSSNRYGYVPVENMDLNIHGIMELGKMATASNRTNVNGLRDGEHTSTGRRTPDHYAMNHESFSDDSEEWTCDDDDPAYSSPSKIAHIRLNQAPATPAQVSASGPVHRTQTDGKYTNAQAQQEALQKLSTFFTQPKTPSQPQPINNTPRMEVPKPENPGNLNEEDEDLDIPVFKVLPPPDLYADIIAGDSMPIYSKPNKTSTK